MEDNKTVKVHNLIFNGKIDAFLKAIVSCLCKISSRLQVRVLIMHVCVIYLLLSPLATPIKSDELYLSPSNIGMTNGLSKRLSDGKGIWFS